MEKWKKKDREKRGTTDNKYTVTLTKRDHDNFLVGGEQMEIDVVCPQKKIVKIVGTLSVNFSSPMTDLVGQIY